MPSHFQLLCLDHAIIGGLSNLGVTYTISWISNFISNLIVLKKDSYAFVMSLSPANEPTGVLGGMQIESVGCQRDVARGTEAVLKADWYLSRRDVMFSFAVDMVGDEWWGAVWG